jgi:hypothetical protein
MKTLRASEIGTYLYCARAWWYQRQGVPSSRLPEMRLGSERHTIHGKRVAGSSLLRFFSIILFILGVGMVLFFITQFSK